MPVTLEVHSANEAPAARSRCARGGFKFPSRRFGPGPCATPSLSLPPAALKSNPTKPQYAISAQLKLPVRVYHRLGIHEHLSAIRWIFNRHCREVGVQVRACRLGAHWHAPTGTRCVPRSSPIPTATSGRFQVPLKCLAPVGTTAPTVTTFAQACPAPRSSVAGTP